MEKDLKEVLNETWRGGKVPEEWKIGMIRPIFKKGKANEVGNYRGITLLDTGYKIYAEILRKRLEKEIEEKEVLDQTQMSFRKGKGTIEAVYTLKGATDGEIKKEKGKVLVCFADMKAAFDKQRRRRIWERLRKKGVRNNLINRIEDLFKETLVRIEIDGEIIDEFEVMEGVRQGCPLSPTLFNVAIADLEEEIGKVQGGGVKFGRRRLRTLAYADDIAIIAEDEEIMKEMLKRLKNWLRGKGLELNAEKTKIMMFRKVGRRKKKMAFKWNREELEMVKKFE